MRRHEIFVLNRLVERVGVGGNTVLKVKQTIGIAINLFFWRRGQTDQQTVEIIKNRPITLIDRPMCFIDDDKIKMAGAKAGLP
ncbi:hypothetical protein D9M70_593280 [compost metagenome]